MIEGFGFFDKMQTGVLHLRIRFLNDIIATVSKLCSLIPSICERLGFPIH